MPQYRVRIYETYAVDYTVDANDAIEALEAVESGEVEKDGEEFLYEADRPRVVLLINGEEVDGE